MHFVHTKMSAHVFRVDDEILMIELENVGPYMCVILIDVMYFPKVKPQKRYIHISVMWSKLIATSTYIINIRKRPYTLYGTSLNFMTLKIGTNVESLFCGLHIHVHLFF